MTGEAHRAGAIEMPDRSAADLVRDRYPEGLVRSLERRYPDVKAWADDAVAHGVEQLVKTARTTRGVQYPKAFVAAAATNFLLDAVGLPEAPVEDAGLDGRSRSAEDEALLDELYKTFKQRVDTWETANLRVVTLLFLEAAYEALPLTLEEAAHAARSILGESISVATVWRLRERGFARLVELYQALDLPGEPPAGE